MTTMVSVIPVLMQELDLHHLDWAVQRIKE
jgi:hypothetical protein